MAADGSVCCTTSVAIGQRAFSNYNGIGIHVCYSPQAPSPAAVAALRPTAPQLQPPPMLAVIIDTSMLQGCLQAAQKALAQALSQLNPQTRLLLLLADQAVSIVDLKTPKPQSWVLHGLGAPQQQGSASILPQIVRVADIRATPLAHCEPFLGATLSALRHHPQQQSMQHHLRTTAAAVDIALFLLTASMAAWDVQHRQQQQALDQQMLQLTPMHNARVMLLTGLPSSSTRSASTAAALLQQFEQQQAQQLQQMFRAVGSKAASLDIPLDVITGSLAAPAAVLLQEAVNMSYGRLLHQPGLQPPLAFNIAVIAQSRFGWEGVLDFQVPEGVRVVQVSGPVSPSSKLPDAAVASGRESPVFLLGPGGSAAAGAVAAAAAAAAGAAAPAAAAAGAAAPAAGAPSPAAPHSSLLPPPGPPPAAAAAAAASGALQGSGPMAWSPAASAVPVVSSGSRFVAVLELTQDWQPGDSFEVQVVCEWTAADGRRLRQICSHIISVTDRLTPYLLGLDVPAVVLLMAQRLVASAAAAAVPATNGLRFAAAPKPRALEEGRLAIGMALAHVAQRMGHAHVSRRGWFGSQQVWQLPDDLIPLALSLYQLQRSPLLDPAALEPDPSDLAMQQQQQQIDGIVFTNKSSSSSSGLGPIMYGSWRLLVQQFIQTSPSAALRMVAPWLYVYDASSGQFEVLPPLNLALEPDALAVLDCGNELLIYVGEVLEALVEGVIPPAKEGANAGFGSTYAAAAAAAVGEGVQEAQQQQQQQQGVASSIESAAEAAAAAAANGRPAVRDMAVAAAPAVSCAHQLLRGRVPVPAVRLIEDEAGMAALMQRLVPLHEDPVALQLLLLPHLRDLSPAQHGYLLDWHKHWAAAGAAAAAAAQGGVSGRAAGGARMVRGEGVSGQLSFGQWYSSFGVVLRSPGGMLEGSPAVE